MNPIRESETDRKIEQAAERFWSAFQMTENGRVKSTLLLYSFCLCWVFFGVPSVLATALCGLTWLLPGDRRLLPATYLWMAALTIACLIAMLVIMNGEAAGLVLQFFALYTLAPLGLGGALNTLQSGIANWLIIGK